MAKSKQPPLVRGVYVALATPRRPDSTEADAAALLEYLDTVVRTGVDGIVLFGSTGEFIHFDTTERMRALTLAIRRSRVPVLVNVSHSTVAGAIDLAEHATDSGAAGLLIMPPYFYDYTGEQLFSFFEVFAAALGGHAPLYLYNIPRFTNSIPPGLMARLIRSGAFAGVKDSSGEWQSFEQLRELRGEIPFTLLIGSETLYFRGRSAGADGIVSGVSAALPELVVAMDRAICSGDHERAQRLNARLEELLLWIEKFPPTVALKQAAVARGWPLNHFAFPFDEDSLADLAGFHHWLNNWLPTVLRECTEAAAVKA